MSVNQSLKPVTIERKDSLFLGGCNLIELANQYKTPLYVMDEVSLRTVCREYQGAFSSHENIKLMYASKALSTTAIAKILDQEGFGFDTVSKGEIYTVLKAGINPNKILFNGNNKTKEDIEFAIKNKITRFSIDNFREANLLNEIAKNNDINVEVLLRITPGIECHTHNYIQTGQIDSKFGFDLSQINEIVTLIKENYKNLKLKGLHAHIGSQIFELQSYHDEVEVLVKELTRINEHFDLTLSELNIGGGLGVKYTEQDNPPSIAELAEVIKKVLEKHKTKISALYLEPGRSIVSTSCITLYTVGSSKILPNGKKYVALDGGMADNPRPSMYQAEYTAELVNNPENRILQEVTLAGRYCESGDIIINNTLLPELKPDDIVCIYNTGAYNYSMASNYNRVEKPAMVLVNNSQSDMIIYRESLDDLIAHDNIPDRLA